MSLSRTETNCKMLKGAVLLRVLQRSFQNQQCVCVCVFVCVCVCLSLHTLLEVGLHGCGGLESLKLAGYAGRLETQGRADVTA